MSDTRWKRHERVIAERLGGRRLPNSGAGQPDVLAGRLAVQVKTRQALPTWLVAAIEQATRDASAGMTPVVARCEARQGVQTRRLVVLDLDHFAALLAASEAETGDRRHNPRIPGIA